MFEAILRLIILFVVIIDPLLSFIFFITQTKDMTKNEKKVVRRTKKTMEEDIDSSLDE